MFYNFTPNSNRHLPLPQHGRQPGVGILEAGRDQARRPLPDPGAVRPGVPGGAEGLRRVGEPAVDHAGGRPGAPPQDQRVPGLAGPEPAGSECPALQLGVVLAALVLRQVRVRGKSKLDLEDRVIYTRKSRDSIGEPTTEFVRANCMCMIVMMIYQVDLLLNTKHSLIIIKLRLLYTIL